MIMDGNKIIVCSYCGYTMENINGRLTCLSCFSESGGRSKPVMADIPDELDCEIPECRSMLKKREGDMYTVTEAHRDACINGGLKVGDTIMLKEIPFVDMRFGKFYCGCRGWS